ncbi:hypothetical protein R3P38DRAFT_3175074 [Favolaschia claudopus]|uniref:Uncharacterized protein n=1 Tax=Favolaschia claudopus TaxID=2862362 RepID=A0AAW0D8C7_9AGAR
MAMNRLPSRFHCPSTTILSPLLTSRRQPDAKSPDCPSFRRLVVNAPPTMYLQRGKRGNAPWKRTESVGNMVNILSTSICLFLSRFPPCLRRHFNPTVSSTLALRRSPHPARAEADRRRCFPSRPALTRAAIFLRTLPPFRRSVPSPTHTLPLPLLRSLHLNSPRRRRLASPAAIPPQPKLCTKRASLTTRQPSKPTARLNVNAPLRTNIPTPLHLRLSVPTRPDDALGSYQLRNPRTDGSSTRRGDLLLSIFIGTAQEERQCRRNTPRKPTTSPFTSPPPTPVPTLDSVSLTSTDPRLSESTPLLRLGNPSTQPASRRASSPRVNSRAPPSRYRINR